MIDVEDEIQVASETISIRCENASVNDEGQLLLPSASVAYGSVTKVLEFDDELNFHEAKQEVVDRLFGYMESDNSEGNIYGKDFDSPRCIEPGTKRAEIIQVVADNSPITSREVGAATDVNYASSELSALRDKGLVEPVAQKDDQYVYAITPLGLSEVIAHRNGSLTQGERQSGLNELFGNEEPEN